MIVCVTDDLLFSIKISTAAKQLQVNVYFERAADRVLATIRDKQPSLVIFDLNSVRMRPIEALAEISKDPGIGGVRTLGYVSHTDTATIAAARAAGIGDVIARSAFVAQLGQILTTG